MKSLKICEKPFPLPMVVFNISVMLKRLGFKYAARLKDLLTDSWKTYFQAN